MPEKPADQKKMVETILEEYQERCKKGPIRVYILADPQTDIEQNIHLYTTNSSGKEKTVKKYFVEDNGKQFYYAQSGNSKIENAISRGEHEVFLTNEDLNFEHTSHICSFKHEKLVHKLSK